MLPIHTQIANASSLVIMGSHYAPLMSYAS
jgi:hypothetical protein